MGTARTVERALQVQVHMIHMSDDVTARFFYVYDEIPTPPTPTFAYFHVAPFFSSGALRAGPLAACNVESSIRIPILGMGSFFHVFSLPG